MTDRRRLNGPAGGTLPPTFVDRIESIAKPQRTRKTNELRRIFLRTGLIPFASGSAYLELEAPATKHDFIPTNSTIKLSCAVHGPKPLPRNAAFSPNLQLNASIKFAPFAARQRRGYIRDNIERDLGSHLENALQGVIIPDRWPKSVVDIVIIVLEGEEDCLWAQENGQEKGIGGVGLMNVLAGSITVAAAALADAGIDCLDLITGGVVGLVSGAAGDVVEVLDPCPSEHEEISAACVVGYLPSRDEVTEVWSKGGAEDNALELEKLINGAIRAAKGVHGILAETIVETIQQKQQLDNGQNMAAMQDIEMTT